MQACLTPVCALAHLPHDATKYLNPAMQTASRPELLCVQHSNGLSKVYQRGASRACTITCNWPWASWARRSCSAISCWASLSLPAVAEASADGPAAADCDRRCCCSQNEPDVREHYERRGTLTEIHAPEITLRHAKLAADMTDDNCCSLATCTRNPAWPSARAFLSALHLGS